MKRTRILGLALMSLMAMLALSASISASASASLPELLPEATEANPITFTNKSTAGTKTNLETKSGEKTTCEKATSTGSATSLKLGRFDILFEKCTAKKFGVTATCTGLNDKTAGSILVLGTFHVWYGLLKTTKEDLHTALVFLIEEVHFTCAALGLEELILVRGCAAGLLLPLNELVKVLDTEFERALNAKKEAEKGVNDITLVLNEKNEEISCKLETSLGGKAFEQSSQEGMGEIEKFEQGKKAITVLIMA